MKFVDQSILHDPENGKYGDCMRACLATIFDAPIESIPHRNEDITGEEQDKMFNEWLARYGVCLQPMSVDGDYFAYMKELGVKTIIHLIYGYTERGTYHAVVAENGVVIHDPHVSKAGLLPNDAGREWRYVFFMMASNNQRAKAQGEV
jgi:hypothetical protein